MFKVGDRVKLNLKRLWEAEAFSVGGPGYGITCEGLRLVKVDKPLYHYALYHPDGRLKACDTDRLGVERIEDGVVFLENDVVLSLPEAELCLEKVQEKENSFEELFEELSDAVTLDEVQRYGIRLYQKDCDADGVNYDVNIYSYQDKNWFIAYKNCECIAFHEHDGEVPQKKASENPRKRVVQISVDVEIDAAENGDVVAEQIAEELEGCGRVVLGSAFQEDMSLEYDYEVEI